MEQTISIPVLSSKFREDGEPARARIGPYRKLTDRQRNDNVVEVKSAAAGPVGAGS